MDLRLGLPCSPSPSPKIAPPSSGFPRPSQGVHILLYVAIPLLSRRIFSLVRKGPGIGAGSSFVVYSVALRAIHFHSLKRLSKASLS